MKAYKGTNILITGGAGFIGSHIAEKLLAEAAIVTILDNFSTGTMNNLQHIADRITIINGDIRSRYDVKNALTDCEYVFHCAALTSVPQSFEQPQLCHAINVKGTEILLEESVNAGVTSFVFSSSSAVYGNKAGINKENDTPNPQSPYAESKLRGETLCKQFAFNHTINTVCLRYFNVYGPRQNPHGAYAAVVAQFKEKLQNQEPITIFGDGTQTRDFVPVSHVIEANLLLARMHHQPGDCFNIATGSSISIQTLLNQLAAEVGLQPVSVTFEPARHGDILYSQACCEKYKNRVK